MKISRLLSNGKSLTTLMLFGLLLAWATAGRLRYGYPFRLLFPDTCIYIPDEEVIPTLIVFLVGFDLASTCFGILIRRSALARRLILRLLVALIAFAFGLFITNAT